uniref:Glutathione S-transferase n=1 Tax=Plectus sambesii TaxID=2011161 RepID=A0A914XMX5_9BILA
MELPTIQQTLFVLFTSYLMKWLMPKLMALLKGDKKTVEIHEKEWKKDVVYLYQFPRSTHMPSMSPFSLKLETWLCANDIKYEVRPTWTQRSSKGQIPFIELNGEHFADSQLIINMLSRKFDKEDTKILTQSQMGTARAVDRLIEGSFVKQVHFSFTLLHRFDAIVAFKYLDHLPDLISGETMGLKWVPRVVTDVAAMFAKPAFAKKLYAQGFGRLTREEQIEQARLDLQAIADVMGKNKFILGDEPHAVDFTLFGHFATFYYLPFDVVLKRMVRDEFPSLLDHMERMKERFWPDWNKHLAA